MQNQTPSVIKSGDVMLAGRRPVGRDADGASTRPSQAQAAARIMAEDAAGATLEVVCSCGKRSYVRCAYRKSPQPAPAPTGQAGQSAAAPDSQENPL